MMTNTELEIIESLNFKEEIPCESTSKHCKNLGGHKADWYVKRNMCCHGTGGWIVQALCADRVNYFIVYAYMEIACSKCLKPLGFVAHNFRPLEKIK